MESHSFIHYNCRVSSNNLDNYYSKLSPGDCNQINVVDDEDNDVSRLDLVKIHKYSFFSFRYLKLLINLCLEIKKKIKSKDKITDNEVYIIY